MLLYTQIENGQAQCPVNTLEHFVAQSVIDNIDASPEELANAGLVAVTIFEGQAPVDGNEYTLEIRQQEDDSWAQQLVQKTIPEAQYLNNVAVQTQAVKADRDRMIASTDWLVTKAAEEGAPVPQAWRDYRQALRDIPTQPGFPFDITWPIKP